MTYIQCTPTQPQLIAVSRLEKSPLNARRTAAKVGMGELKASLLAHGLMQNLVITDTGDGTYRVIAGGDALRRFIRSRPRASCQRISRCRAISSPRNTPWR